MDSASVLILESYVVPSQIEMLLKIIFKKTIEHFAEELTNYMNIH